LVCIPQERIDAVLVAAREIADAEERIRTAVTGGQSLRSARAAYNYHQLQTRRAD
jgi:regulator of RNase E activity RraA